MGRPKQDDEYKFTENAIEWLSGERKATVTVSQKKWVDLIKKCNCKKTVNKDGSVTARVPIEWIRIEPKGDDG